MTDTKIALGTWSWGVGSVGGNEVFGNELGADELAPVFEAARGAGLNLWDTATVYGMGASEELLGTFARICPRDELVLSTKFTPQIAGNGENPVADLCEASLKRLGTDYIDIYWIHNPADVERWTPLLVPLVKEGKVRRVGASNHNLAQIERAEEILSAEDVHVSAIQNHYSLLYRGSEKAGIIDWCHEHGADFFAYMVLEQGALSGAYDEDHPLPAGSQRAATYNPLLPQISELIAAMREVGAAHGASVAEVAEAWAMAKGTVPLVGVTKPAHVASAARAAGIELAADEVSRIEELADAAQVDTRGSWEAPMA